MASRSVVLPDPFGPVSAIRSGPMRTTGRSPPDSTGNSRVARRRDVATSGSGSWMRMLASSRTRPSARSTASRASARRASCSPLSFPAETWARAFCPFMRIFGARLLACAFFPARRLPAILASASLRSRCSDLSAPSAERSACAAAFCSRWSCSR
ncbi:hypothetical protein ACFPRL_08960 [Pseudoclavibacter helvolus]